MTRRSTILSLALVATSVLPAQNPIVGIWDFDETSGFTANDVGPNANHGTLVNFTNDPSQWTVGVRGNALSFDGADDYVQLATNAGLPFYDGLGATFSVCMWINGQPTDDDRVLALASSASNTPLWTIGTGRNSLSNPDKLQVYVRNGEGGFLERYSDATVFDGAWHHIAYVETSGRARLYVDGVRDIASWDDRFNTRGTRGPSHGTYVMDLVAVGAVLRTATCCNFTGSLDELRVYGFALSDADVMAVMGGTQPGVCRASIGDYGVGCGAGPLDLYAAGTPVLGGPGLLFTMSGGPANAITFLNIGVGRIAPLELGSVGIPGCTMFAPTGTLIPSGALNSFGSSPAGYRLVIPNAGGLACVSTSFQGVALGAGGADFSNAVIAMLGN